MEVHLTEADISADGRFAPRTGHPEKDAIDRT
jgi:hypothetical protein